MGNLTRRTRLSPLMRSSFRNPVEDIFDDFFNMFSGVEYNKNDLFAQSSYPKIDIAEDGSDVVIDAALAGFTMDDVKIDIDDRNRVLTLSGKSSLERHDDGQYAVREIKRSSFVRSVTLPEYLDLDEIDASLKNGMLTIRIPRREDYEQKPSRRLIEIKSE